MNAKDYLDWLLGGAKPTDVSSDFQWAVVQATDTLVWCLREGDAWRRTDLEPGSGMRPLKADRIFEARFFGPDAQLLLWRTNGEEWNQFQLATEPDPAKSTEQTWFYAHEIERQEAEREKRRWTAPDACGPFLSHTDRAGRVSVVPRGRGVRVTQHLEEDLETGLVRIATTRFVEIVEK